MTTADEMSREAEMYWHCSTCLRRAARENAAEQVAEFADELQVLRDYTNWPALRERLSAETVTHDVPAPTVLLASVVGGPT